MDLKNFVGRVGKYSGIEDPEEVENLVKIVFYLLSARLTIREGEELKAQLPKDLKAVWDAVKETKVDVIKFSKKEFLERAMRDGKLRDIKNAEKVVISIFKTLKELVSEGEARDVAAQLPVGLKDMWSKA